MKLPLALVAEDDAFHLDRRSGALQHDLDDTWQLGDVRIQGCRRVLSRNLCRVALVLACGPRSLVGPRLGEVQLGPAMCPWCSSLRKLVIILTCLQTHDLLPPHSAPTYPALCLPDEGADD